MHPAEPRRVELARLPTPLIELPRLARDLGVPRLLCKRDDLTGLEVSGNKIRKLEYLLADAIDRGCDSIITHGGHQSNHCRATASAAARLGLRLRLLLRAPPTPPANIGNLFLDRLLGASVTLHDAESYTSRRPALIEEAMAAERAAGRKPYFFPVGGSVPLGCWGYMRAMRELIDQVDTAGPVDLYVPVSSAGTCAGLVLGRALFRADNWSIVGIPVSDSVPDFERSIAALCLQTIEAYRLPIRPEEARVELLDGFIGEGYAVPTAASLDALRRVARLEGMLLDPTYTSKAFAGVMQTLRERRRDATPIFLHTGGVFGLLARTDLFPPEEC